MSTADWSSGPWPACGFRPFSRFLQAPTSDVLRGQSAQFDAKTGVPVFARPADPPAVSFRHLASDGKTEADALSLAGDEGLEQSLRQLGGRPRPGVDHFHHNGGSTFFQSAIDADPAAGAGRLDRVAQHVEEQLLQLTRVSRQSEFIRRRLP